MSQEVQTTTGQPFIRLHTGLISHFYYRLVDADYMFAEFTREVTYQARIKSCLFVGTAKSPVSIKIEFYQRSANNPIWIYCDTNSIIDDIECGKSGTPKILTWESGPYQMYLQKNDTFTVIEDHERQFLCFLHVDSGITLCLPMTNDKGEIKYC